jgi:hypothetical protein
MTESDVDQHYHITTKKLPSDALKIIIICIFFNDCYTFVPSVSKLDMNFRQSFITLVFRSNQFFFQVVQISRHANNVCVNSESCFRHLRASLIMHVSLTNDCSFAVVSEDR